MWGASSRKRIKKYSLVSGWPNSVENIILLLLSVIIIIIKDNSEKCFINNQHVSRCGRVGYKEICQKEKWWFWYWISEVWYDLRWQVRGSKRHLDRQLRRKIRDDWLRDDNIRESWTLQWNSSSRSFLYNGLGCYNNIFYLFWFNLFFWVQDLLPNNLSINGISS